MSRYAMTLAVAVGVCLLAVGLMNRTALACQGCGCTADESSLPEVGPEFDIMQRAELLFLGTLTKAQAGPVAQSNPPIHTFQLTLTVSESLRGDLPAAEEIVVSYQARQVQPPTFPVGEAFLVVGYQDLRIERLVTTWVNPASEELLAQVRLAGALPIGWSVVDGQRVSPWASLDEIAWPEDAAEEAPACAETGRPVLFAGEGVTLTVEPVPPAENIKWTNPDGDGEYTITVTNTTDEAVDIPALLSDSGGIRWNESLVIVCQDVARPAPLAEALTETPTPTRLEAGESVSTVVNAFRLENIEWPRGGYRVEFTFCLGELAVTRSFYYKSDHHDPIRAALQE